MEQENMSSVSAIQGKLLPNILSPVEVAEDIEMVASEDAANIEQRQKNESAADSDEEVTTPLIREEGYEITVNRDATEEQSDVDQNGDAEDTEQRSALENERVEKAIEKNTADEKREVIEVKELRDVIAEDGPAQVYGRDSSKLDVIGDEETPLVDGNVTCHDTQKEETGGYDVEELNDVLTFGTREILVDVKKESLSIKVGKPTLSIEIDAPIENQTKLDINNLVSDEAVAILDEALQFPQGMELASPAALPDLLVAASDVSTDNTNDLIVLEDDADESGNQIVNEDKNEQGDHATITAVTESAEKSVPVDANLEVVLEEIRTKFPFEAVEALESGEVQVLPNGWSTRKSKSNDGKMYYVSPYGHTQWLRPPIKTGVIYNWVHEIEVTFGPGRLGLNLKQIAGLPGTTFTDLQVHIMEIYKLPNGMASPAEIYNWSVKPEKRLALNMRITMMNGIPMTGYTYSEVLELLARLVRPVHIKFADITKGIVGRAEEEILHEDSEEVKEARAARVMQNSLRMEYFQILVSSELHKQVRAAMKHHIHLKCREMEKKCEVIEAQVEREQRHQESLKKECGNLIREDVSLKSMIEKLDMQVAGEIESPEVLRTAELVQRAAELDKDVSEIIAENAELQAARVKTEETLDCLQKELDEHGDLDMNWNGQQDIKFFSPAFLGSMVHRGSIDTRAEDARERLLLKVKAQHDHLQEEIKMEEERAKFVRSEIYQFKNQMDVAAAAVKREDAFISGERPPQLIFLENKIVLLKKNLRETVSGIVTATSSGDQQQSENLLLRRAVLKDDLKAALDEMRRMENELQVAYDVDTGKKIALQYADSSIDTVDIDEAPHKRVSELSRLQNKLIKLQTQLHDTVVELAKAADEKDEERKNELGKRRFRLKDEMKVVQDQFQFLTNETLNVSAKAKESYLRPSVSPPLLHDVPRRSTGTSRASFGGFRSSIIGSRASMGGSQASHGGNRASASVRRVSELFDPNRNHRSSNSAFVALTQSHDSNSYEIPRDGSLPTMSGILRKHATHSNEKGTFGNISLRGVRERWFNIEPDGFLRYYKREGDREPRGSIPLKHKSLEILYGKDVGKPNEFMMCSPTQQTRMLAKTQDEMLKWVKVLKLAHVYFMQQFDDDSGQAPGSMSLSGESMATAKSPGSADDELAYRNKRATLGF